MITVLITYVLQITYDNIHFYFVESVTFTPFKSNCMQVLITIYIKKIQPGKLLIRLFEKICITFAE
jgi:hypothetical protein